MEKRALMPITINDTGPGNRNTNWALLDNAEPPRSLRYIDPDFVDESNPGHSVLDEGKDQYLTTSEDQAANWLLLPTILEVEAICAALINQGLMKAFVSHKQKRIAIQGAKTKGALAAGWPRVWDVVREREGKENPGGTVPGWKREMPEQLNRLAGRAPGPGTVVRLTGARPVGMGP